MAGINWKLWIGAAVAVAISWIALDGSPTHASEPHALSGVLNEEDTLVAGLAQGDDFAAKGRHREAIQVYINTLKRGQLRHPEILIFNLGLSFSAVSDHRKALAAFAQAADLLPAGTLRYREVHSRAGEEAARIGWWDRAAKHFGSAAGYGEGSSSASADPSAWFNFAAATLNSYLGLEPDSRDLGVLRAADAGFANALRLRPGDDKSIAHLGVTRVLASDVDQGEALLAKLDSSSDPNLHLYVGFALGEPAPRVAARHLEYVVQTTGASKVPQHKTSMGLGWNAQNTQLSSVFYRLGRAYRKIGDLQSEANTYKRAVSIGIWNDIDQRPGFLFPRPLPSSPFPRHNTSLLKDPLFKPVWDAAHRLEANFPEILSEFLSASAPLSADNEGIADSGVWNQLILGRNGHVIPQVWEQNGFNATRRTLKPIRQTVAHKLPKGSIEFSVLQPGTHLRPHCGPSNHRLRLHLALQIPSVQATDTQPTYIQNTDIQNTDIQNTDIRTTETTTREFEDIRIRVGSETRRWEQGRVLVIDDSYDHEVWNPTNTPRIVLLVDVWHPYLSEQDRNLVRKHFGFSQSSWWTTHSPWGRLAPL